MDRLTDRVEGLVRNRRRWQIVQLLVGDPFIGAIVGLGSAGLAFLACLAPTPYEFIISAATIAVVLAAFDRLSLRLEEPAGDQVSRGFTRVFGWAWISHRDRPRWDSAFEPWRTTTMVAIFLLTVDRSSAVDLESWMWWSGLPWVAKGAALGAGIALLKSLFRRSTGVLGRLCYSTGVQWSSLPREQSVHRPDLPRVVGRLLRNLSNTLGRP